MQIYSIRGLIIKCILALALLLLGYKSLHSPAPEVFVPTSQQCMKANLFFEARGESELGMKAVAAVTYNRAKHKNYPDEVCDVVFQPKQFSWTHQIDYGTIIAVMKGDASSFSQRDQRKLKIAEKIAKLSRKELQKALPYATIFYHSKKVKPFWAGSKKRVAVLGNHVFYKE